jgi:RNA recognition motif-containing protein
LSYLFGLAIKFSCFLVLLSCLPLSYSHFFLINFLLMNIFVAKLNFDTNESELQNAFERFGEVESVKIIMDKFTGRSKGFGFVEMPNDDEAREAISNLNDQELDGRTIVVKKAEPRESRDRGGFGGGGGRGGYGGGGGGRRY